MSLKLWIFFHFGRWLDVAKPGCERGHLEANLALWDTDLMSKPSTGCLCFISHQVLEVLGCRSRCLAGYPLGGKTKSLLKCYSWICLATTGVLPILCKLLILSTNTRLLLDKPVNQILTTEIV